MLSDKYDFWILVALSIHIDKLSVSCSVKKNDGKFKHDFFNYGSLVAFSIHIDKS